MKETNIIQLSTSQLYVYFSIKIKITMLVVNKLENVPKYHPNQFDQVKPPKIVILRHKF